MGHARYNWLNREVEVMAYLNKAKELHVPTEEEVKAVVTYDLQQVGRA